MPNNEDVKNLDVQIKELAIRIQPVNESRLAGQKYPDDIRESVLTLLKSKHVRIVELANKLDLCKSTIHYWAMFDRNKQKQPKKNKPLSKIPVSNKFTKINIVADQALGPQNILAQQNKMRCIILSGLNDASLAKVLNQVGW